MQLNKTERNVEEERKDAFIHYACLQAIHS